MTLLLQKAFTFSAFLCKLRIASMVENKNPLQIPNICGHARTKRIGTVKAKQETGRQVSLGKSLTRREKETALAFHLLI
jgi:hypothetical protein